MTRPAVRHIALSDLRIVLAEGWADFSANPTHIIFLCALYPIVGLLLGRAAAGNDTLPLVFPLVAGFALIGPLAALGLYEISRRREHGLPVSWRDAFRVVRARNLWAIMLLGVVMMLVFVLWLQTACWVFRATVGTAPDSIGQFARVVLTTWKGWELIVLGHLVGLPFALAVLSSTVISFPMLLDRDLPGGAAMQASFAVSTSLAAVRANPVTMLAWGLIVAVALALGSAPFFIGLAVVLPILGHATWHLYRRTIVPD